MSDLVSLAFVGLVAIVAVIMLARGTVGVLFGGFMGLTFSAMMTAAVGMTLLSFVASLLLAGGGSSDPAAVPTTVGGWITHSTLVAFASPTVGSVACVSVLLLVGYGINAGTALLQEMEILLTALVTKAEGEGN